MGWGRPFLLGVGIGPSFLGLVLPILWRQVGDSFLGCAFPLGVGVDLFFGVGGGGGRSFLLKFGCCPFLHGLGVGPSLGWPFHLVLRFMLGVWSFPLGFGFRPGDVISFFGLGAGLLWGWGRRSFSALIDYGSQTLFADKSSWASVGRSRGTCKISCSVCYKKGKQHRPKQTQ